MPLQGLVPFSILFILRDVLSLKCGDGTLPCLPGLDGVGIGFDAVKGQSFGSGLQVINMTFGKGHTYTDPFGNRTIYAYPDQATVSAKSDQFMGHHVIRSVSQWVATQADWAGVSASYSSWFSASAETKDVASQMSDKMYIMIESRAKLGLYQASINPPDQLQPSDAFQASISHLPAQYDEAAYFDLIKYYGTHYIRAAEFGGIARMRTTVTQSYYSTTSDSELQAQASIQWGLFGGGAGGGTSQKDTSQEWKDSTSSTTYAAGGDPAIKSFSSSEEWTAWAKSVETSSPTVTQYYLEDLSNMVKDGDKKPNLQKALLAYAVANNKTWPAADPVNYQMDWCDCYSTGDWVGDRNPCPSSDYPGDWTRYQWTCKEGYFLNEVYPLTPGSGGHGHDGGLRKMSCCRPCFRSSHAKAETTKKLVV